MTMTKDWVELFKSIGEVHATIAVLNERVRQRDVEIARLISERDTAHLTQPAQSVDVEKVKEVIASHRHEITLCNKHDQESIDYLMEMADKLTAALQEKGNG